MGRVVAPPRPVRLSTRKLAPVPRARRFEYRVCWVYQGGKAVHSKIMAMPQQVLSHVRLLVSPHPWIGARKTHLRSVWNRLAARLDVPVADLAHLPLREACLALRATFPPLDWMRVEFRQVGRWTEMVEPLAYLHTPQTDQADARSAALLAWVEAMTPEELQKWRAAPITLRPAPYPAWRISPVLKRALDTTRRALGVTPVVRPPQGPIGR